jgi:methylenetetrahydrofolate dehydrogenase (NADP+)/methenyltetrahydrofolate cyclohydrolase
MPAKLIKGAKVAEKIRGEIAAELNKLYNLTGLIPGLSVILIGENPASLSHVTNIEKQGAKLGFFSQIHRLPADVGQKEVLELTRELNENNSIHGFMIQLPLPGQIDERAVIEAIDPEKDVEGAHPINLGKLFCDEEGYIPCSASSVMHMIEFTGQPILGKSAVVVGRSNIMGKPLSLLLLRRNTSVTICHTHTKNLAEICREADILVSVVGQPGLITKDYVKPGSIVIDVGLTEVKGRLAGDVAFEEVREVAGWLSPVPGGVGPISITMLFWNTLQAFKRKMQL